MRRLIVSLNLDKPAFKDNPGDEVARLLRDAAYVAANLGGIAKMHGLALCDMEGEKVGLVDVLDDDAKPQTLAPDPQETLQDDWEKARDDEQRDQAS